VELIIESIATVFFREKFKIGMEVAGVAAACFSVMNVVSRPMGGIASDKLGAMFGMRGRLWGLWIVQTIGGLICLMFGRMNDDSASLEFTLAMLVVLAFFVQAASGLTFGVVPFVSKR
jgi:MFS transporter, NNP family, nitrate/nitrite transporter